MRLYRLLLGLYPPRFRRRYRAELEAAFSADRLLARHTGFLGAARFWAHILGDLLVTASRQRLAEAHATYAGVPGLPANPQRTQMDTVFQDIRYALRSFARRPGFTAVSLALGIGGNSVIYGLVDGFVLRPFPYPDPDRLISVGVSFPKVSSDVGYVEVLSLAEYADIRTATSFAATAAFDLGNRTISDGQVAERVFTGLLMDDLFPVIGMKPALGRGFTRDEMAPNAPPVAIISHRLWQTRFGSAPSIVNRAIRIGGMSATVVGVMPQGLLLIGTDLWIPWGGDPSRVPRNVRQFSVLARLAPGVTLTQANTELATIAGRVEQTEKAAFKEYEGWRLAATPWAAALMKDLRPAAFLLLGAVGLVLLIACANLTNLMLARSTSRARELAVRLALGAARWRLVRHLLTESILLALAGGVAGVFIAHIGLKGAGALIPSQLESLDLQAGLNVRVLVWSLGLTLAAGVLVGVLPGLHATRTDPHESLKADGRGGAGRTGSRARAVLVVAEIALSVVLLLGAGLLMRSFLNVHAVESGYEPRGVLTMRLTLPRERYPGEAANAFFDRLLERLAAVPGVRSVAAASQYPPMATFDTQFAVERQQAPEGTIPTALITVTTPGLFDALRVPLRSGRIFSATDRLDTPPVVMVNQAFASRYFAGVDAIGQRLAIGSPKPGRPWATVVGVVADYRNGGATRAIRPEIYMPVRQQNVWNQLFVLVRGEGAPAALLPSVRRAIREIDPEQPIYAVQTLEEAVAQSSFQQRIAALLLSIFAGVALVMAAVGIFGVMSYSVSARTQEMGVRLAFGAQRRDVVWLVISHVLKLAGVGLIIGVALLLAGRQAIAGLLFGVEAADATTIVSVTLVLALVAVIAAWVPAFRASRVDPIEALRYE
jgi:predicted permease